MSTFAKILSWSALLAALLGALLFFTGRLPHGQLNHWLLGASLLWFATAPLWMERGRP
jgi:hypothetical protein